MRGFTTQHPDIPPELRGTYAGLAHPAVIEHLQRARRHRRRAAADPPLRVRAAPAAARPAATTGATTRSASSPRTRPTRPAPATRCASSRRWCGRCTRPGIEVILDVVYNHTAEGGPDGPMLSFRGIDNGSYYRLADDDPSRYVDYTGCGNTFDPRRPFPLQLITDSLRYWITEMHVDGFRFDLASALARSLHDVDKLSSFFDTIHQDPVISQVKLIAEPWDVGDGGYQVGEFPPLWTEWNGKYRDTVRSFWAHGRRRRARPRLPAVRLVRPLRRRRPAADRVDQLRHRARRLHDARPRLLRAQAQRGQRRGQPRRHRRQPLVQLRRRGRPRAARRRDAAPAPGAQPADRRCCCRPARRCSWPATRCGAPSAATTTPTPGQRDLVGRLVAAAPRPTTCSALVRRLLRPAARRTRCCGRARSSRAGAVDDRRRPASTKDLAWFHPAGREIDRRRLVRHRAALDRHVPRRARAAAPQPARRADHRRVVPAAAALRRRRRRRSPCPARRGRTPTSR